MDIQELHEKILYPVVRVKTEKAGGSGVLVYSAPDSKHNGKFINLILTCEHVIDSAIKIKDDWDPVLKRDRKKEFFEEVVVELFDYDGSKVVSSNAMQADIVAYDKHHDLALLRLHNTRQLSFVAPIISKKDIEQLQLFESVWASGCSLLHDAFASPGLLTYLREVIDQKTYLMSSASSIFGNSGGALFRGSTGELLGLTSRVTTLQLGFGIDVITWMQFSTHPERLYEFMDDQELQFIYNPNDDFYTAQERRDRRKNAALRSLLVEDQQKRESPASLLPFGDV